MTARPAGPLGSVGVSVARAAGLIALVTLLARVVGFGRTLVFSKSVGTTGVGDIYQTINVIPNIVYEVAAGGVLAAVAVPLIAHQLGLGRTDDADRTASALLTWAVVVLTPLSVLLVVLAPWLSGALLGERATDEEVTLGGHLLVLFAPQVLLYGVGIVLAGVLQARRRFLAAALAPLLSSLVVIAAYLVYGVMVDHAATPANVSDAAVWALAGGTTLGVVVLALPLLVPVLRAGVRLRPTLAFPDGLARRAASLAGAGVVALVAQQAAVLTVLWITHHRTDVVGAVNVYAYVQAVYLLPYAVLAVPIATSAFPALAHTAAEESAGFVGTAARDTLARALQGIILLTAGAAAVLMTVSQPVGVFFSNFDRGAGAGGGPALAALPGTLSAYAPGIVGLRRGRPAHQGPVRPRSARARGCRCRGGLGRRRPPAADGAAGGLVRRRHAGGPRCRVVDRHDGLRARPRSAGPPGLGRRGHPRQRPDPGRGRRRGGGGPGSRRRGLPGHARRLRLERVGQRVHGRAGHAGHLPRRHGGGRPQHPQAPARPRSQPAPGECRMRVAMVVGRSTGGIGLHAVDLATHLRALGDDVVFVTDDLTADRFELTDALRWWPTRGGGLRGATRSLRRLHRLARTSDVVHAHGHQAGLLAVLAATGTSTPVVVSQHNAVLGGAGPRPRWRGWPARPWSRPWSRAGRPW